MSFSLFCVFFICAFPELFGFCPLSQVLGVSFSPTGQTIATASKDLTARVWELTGSPIRELRGHTSYVRCVAFCPFEGSEVATGSDDDSARVWEWTSGREVALLNGHRGTVRSVRFSPDSSQVCEPCLLPHRVLNDKSHRYPKEAFFFLSTALGVFGPGTRLR